MTDALFQEIVWQKGRDAYRDMPWRHTHDPYAIFVSEVMLQQTQVERVVPKYIQFLATFPTVSHLAKASLAEVVSLWSGLGYNRRAKYLHDAARMIASSHDSVFPTAPSELQHLPGVGPNTAGAIAAYAYNFPAVFIETNVRTVYFYHYFKDTTLVSDATLRDVVARTVDSEHPREWYWSLMDYGALLKKQGCGNVSQSRHYKKQAPLKGSVREVRGDILRHLAIQPMTSMKLRQVVHGDNRFDVAVAGLLRDGLIEQQGKRLQLPQKTV